MPPSCEVCGAKMRPMASSPRIITRTFNKRHQPPELLKRRPISRFIVPPRAQASRRCETQATLRRQAAKAALAFRSLDPFRALREPDRRRRDEERPIPLRTKNWQRNPKNNRLTVLPSCEFAARRCAPMASSPRIITQTGAVRRRSFEERPISPTAVVAVPFPALRPGDRPRADVLTRKRRRPR